MKFFYSILILSSLCILACEPDLEPPQEMPDDFQVFHQVPAEKSKLDFTNKITATEKYNFLAFDGFYQGGGVGIGDFNGDGLKDIYFAGNMVSDRVYLNTGDLTFQDITKQSGILQDNSWSTGIAVVDINADGYDDVYVSKFLYDDPSRRINHLYINNGDATFSEQAKEWGLNVPGYSIQATFFDYDKDGLIDVYVANQPPNSEAAKRPLEGKKDYYYTDHLLRNTGQNRFEIATKTAGILNYSYSLSATVSDLNRDGWPDIYVACDYDEPDMMYINQKDGTFKNIADEALRHMSNFSMGADIADINNDGWMDIYTADMVANDNQRLKTNMSGMNPEKFWSLARNGYHHQYMFNALQLNQGNGKYSEIAQLSGVSNTDWSWSALLADLDNSGTNDLLVTNGLVKDMRDNDFLRKARKIIADRKSKGEKPDLLQISNTAPSTRIANYAYSNKGNLNFQDVSEEWGLDFKGFSHGAAYADLDNDGDLDLVLNNHEDPASLFENKTADKNYNSYLRFTVPSGMNPAEYYGMRIEIKHNDDVHVRELQPVRGYMSSSEKAVHFGLGMLEKVDKVVIHWPRAGVQIMEDVPTRQEIVLDIDKAQKTNVDRSQARTLFTEKKTDFQHRHVENTFDDYKREILLPHKMSTLGPTTAAADINGDQRTDLFVGGSVGEPGSLYLQDQSGDMKKVSGPWESDVQSEDLAAQFFDADNDGDLDLYVVSGGNEYPAGHKAYQDRLYINDPSGWRKSGALPSMRTSGGTVAAADIDGDGDQDLFVGGRQVPGRYGFAPRSYVLINDGGQFTDQTEKIAPSLMTPGMVSSAVWHDYDQDEDMDLIIAGEWMPISVFTNENGKLSKNTEALGLTNTSGWWNTLELADLNGDGEKDLIAGNLGHNIKYKASEEEPFKLYAKDFDENGTHDVYLGYYDHDGVCYPVRGRQCSSDQMPFIKKKFENYTVFSKATVEEVLEGKMDGAVTREAQLFSSVWIDMSSEKWQVQALPSQAQMFPVFAIECRDWNKDGNIDILLAGNYYNREVETTRSDAGIGCLLSGDGQGSFKAVHPTESGLELYKDVRSMEVLNTGSETMLLVANNNDVFDMYAWKK